MATQDMIDVSVQQQRIVHVKVNLLDFQFNVVDELSGNAVSMPTISINANSDIRRTCQIELVVSDSSFKISQGSKIWLDKYIQVYIGIENIHNDDEVVWMNQGIYLINQPSLKYDPTTYTLSFEGVDLMAKLTGLRNGYIEGIQYVVPSESNIQDVVVDTLALGGFTNYEITISSGQTTTPNELKFDIGSTLYDIISGLRDIYGSYQIYFDVNGVFHFEKIPQSDTGTVADDYIFENVCLSMTEDVDFENVKNVVEILGKTHEVQSYSDTYSVSSGLISLTDSGTTSIYDDILIGFTTGNSDITYSDGLRVQLNSFTARYICDDYGNNITTIPKNQYIVLRYRTTAYSTPKFQYMGFLQAYGYAEDTNSDSPFYTGGSIGKIRIVLSGGEYDNIYTNQLAQERAEYELYLAANVTDSITLECVPLYYLDVQQLISLTLPDSSESQLYRIQTISTSDKQTITASKYYEGVY